MSTPDFKAALGAASFHASWRRFEEDMKKLISNNPAVIEICRHTYYAGAFAFLDGETRIVEIADVGQDPAKLSSTALAALAERAEKCALLIEARRDEVREFISEASARAIINRAKTTTEPKA